MPLTPEEESNKRNHSIGLLIFLVILVIIYLAYAGYKDDDDLISADALDRHLDASGLSPQSKDQMEEIIEKIMKKKELRQSDSEKIRKSMMMGMIRGGMTGLVTGGPNGAVIGALLLGTVSPLTMFLNNYI